MSVRSELQSVIDRRIALQERIGELERELEELKSIDADWNAAVGRLEGHGKAPEKPAKAPKAPKPTPNGAVDFRAVRGKLGLSQGKLAKKLGISQPYLSSLERGKTQPSDAVLAKLKVLESK